MSRSKSTVESVLIAQALERKPKMMICTKPNNCKVLSCIHYEPHEQSTNCDVEGWCCGECIKVTTTKKRKIK